MPMELSENFDEPWPEVLTVIQAWVRRQVLQVGEVRRMELRLSLSRPALIAARREGQTMQPAFDAFRQAIIDDWGMAIPLPDQEHGLHDGNLQHRVRFFYWR